MEGLNLNQEGCLSLRCVVVLRFGVSFEMLSELEAFAAFETDEGANVRVDPPVGEIIMLVELVMTNRLNVFVFFSIRVHVRSEERVRGEGLTCDDEGFPFL